MGLSALDAVWFHYIKAHISSNRDCLIQHPDLSGSPLSKILDKERMAAIISKFRLNSNLHKKVKKIIEFNSISFLYIPAWEGCVRRCRIKSWKTSWNKEEKVEGVERSEWEKHPKAKRKQQKKDSLYKAEVFVSLCFFHFLFGPHILYLPAEAGEEDLTVLVFVLQLLGNADEAWAGQRGISHLQKWEAGIITRSRLVPPATVQRYGNRNVSRCWR